MPARDATPTLPTRRLPGLQSVIILTCCMEYAQTYDAEIEAVYDLPTARGLAAAGRMQPLRRMLQAPLSLPLPALRRGWTQLLRRLRLPAAELPEIPSDLGRKPDQAQLRVLFRRHRRDSQQHPPQATAGCPCDYLIALDRAAIDFPCNWNGIHLATDGTPTPPLTMLSVVADPPPGGIRRLPAAS
jgi:hypothetical protein